PSSARTPGKFFTIPCIRNRDLPVEAGCGVVAGLDMRRTVRGRLEVRQAKRAQQSVRSHDADDESPLCSTVVAVSRRIGRRLRRRVNDLRPAGPAAGTAALLQRLRDGKPRTRAELVAETGLARSTVAERIETLLASGFLRHADKAESTGGRPPTMFA